MRKDDLPEVKYDEDDYEEDADVLSMPREFFVQRPVLVVQWVEKIWRRYSIFETRLFGLGKMYVILGSSIKNLILKEAFEKLKLPTKKDIAWFQKVIKVPINSRSLVEFTMGGDIEDEVWRDVVPMYTCHLSLKVVVM